MLGRRGVGLCVEAAASVCGEPVSAVRAAAVRSAVERRVMAVAEAVWSGSAHSGAAASRTAGGSSPSHAATRSERRMVRPKWMR